MTIASLADYRAAAKQRIGFTKNAVSTQAAQNIYSSYFVSGGSPPGFGNNGVGNTTTGLVPTNATTGAPAIADFSGTGYLTMVEWANTTQVQRVFLYDRLFHVGEFDHGSGLSTLSSQPSFSGRLPTVGGNPDYTGLQIWAETTISSGSNTPTGTFTITVTYTDQDGNTGHTTGAQVMNISNVQGNMMQMALAAGDVGVRKIESVTIAGSSTGGGINIVVVRPLWSGYAPLINQIYRHWLGQTGAPIVFPTSCLALAAVGTASSSTLPLLALDIEIASK